MIKIFLNLNKILETGKVEKYHNFIKNGIGLNSYG